MPSGKGYSEASAAAKHVLAELKAYHTAETNPTGDLSEKIPSPTINPLFLERLGDLSLGSSDAHLSILRVLRGECTDSVDESLQPSISNSVEPSEQQLTVYTPELTNHGDLHSLVQSARDLDRHITTHDEGHTLSTTLQTDDAVEPSGKKRIVNGWILYWKTVRAADVCQVGETKHCKEQRILHEALRAWKEAWAFFEVTRWEVTRWDSSSLILIFNLWFVIRDLTRTI